MDEKLICNEYGKAVLIRELVSARAMYRFSDILSWSYAFTRWRNRYQLEKALKQLINDGLVGEKFVGYNAYGYNTYGATEKARKLIELIKLGELSSEDENVVS